MRTQLIGVTVGCLHVNPATGVRAGVRLNRSDYCLMTLALALAASRTHAGNSSSTLALPVTAAVLSCSAAVAARANWDLFHCVSGQSSIAVNCAVQTCIPAVHCTWDLYLLLLCDERGLCGALWKGCTCLERWGYGTVKQVGFTSPKKC